MTTTTLTNEMRADFPKFHVAFIGAGQFANRFHYATLSQMPDVQIATIGDLLCGREGTGGMDRRTVSRQRGQSDDLRLLHREPGVRGQRARRARRRNKLGGASQDVGTLRTHQRRRIYRAPAGGGTDGEYCCAGRRNGALVWDGPPKSSVNGVLARMTSREQNWKSRSQTAPMPPSGTPYLFSASSAKPLPSSRNIAAISSSLGMTSKS
jgi:hypothetical protein